MRLVLRGRIPHARDTKSVPASVAVKSASPLLGIVPAPPQNRCREMASSIGSHAETWQEGPRIRASGEFTMRQPPCLFS